MKIDRVRYIVVHCSATRSNMTYSGEQLDRDHRRRGMRSSGYHYYIRKGGQIESHRPLTMAGAHALGYNRCSIGLCYEGGLDASGKPSDTRTPQQKRSMHQLLEMLVEQYPTAQIVGHRDLSPDVNGDGVVEPREWCKACPCFDARGEYTSLVGIERGGAR